MPSAGWATVPASKSNVLGAEQQQVVALERLEWSLRRIEAALGVRREAASAYLKAAGIAVRGRGGRPSSGLRAAKSGHSGPGEAGASSNLSRFGWGGAVYSLTTRAEAN